MTSPLLHVVLQTPHAQVLALDVISLQIPADSGRVGLRPRGEPTLLAVEPGLVLARTVTGRRCIGTAGGLLRSDGRLAILLTPLAVVGEDEAGVLAALTAALAEPDPERDLRLAIERLESGIVKELRRVQHRGGENGGGAA